MNRKNITLIIALVLLVVTLTSCSKAQVKGKLWEDALYTEDTQIGKGNKTITLKVTAEEESITLTIKTDKKTVGEALTENEIISGEEGPYGLYVKKVNGIEADYDKTKTYWSFTVNGEAAQTGVDLHEIKDGEEYGFEYKK